MPQNESGEEVLGLPQPTNGAGKTLMAQTIDKFFAVGVDDALPLIEDAIQALDRQTAGAEFETTQITLRALWNYFEAIRVIKTKGDFVAARKSLQSAKSGFDQMGLDELRDLSIGMGVYAEAVTELQKLNISRALDLFENVKMYLESAGKFGSKFKPLIDHMEPEALFVAAVNAMMTSDFASAKVLTEQASQTAQNMANCYYKTEDPLYCSFHGLARFYKAYYTVNRSFRDFNQFNYNELTSKDLEQDAVEAKELMNKGDTNNVIFNNVIYLCECNIQLLCLIRDLAKLMQTIFRSTFKPDPRNLISLKQKIRVAGNAASQAGPQAVALVRFCDQLSIQVDNLERLARPSKKDFGAFSGLIACAAFLPLFLIVSWVNARLGAGLEGSTLITACLVLALIGGFGFGALRFKSLIFPEREAKS
jgi:hypothetical protein